MWSNPYTCKIHHRRKISTNVILPEKEKTKEESFARKYAKWYSADLLLEPSSLESAPESSSDINIKFIERKHIIQSKLGKWINILSYHIWWIKLRPRFLISCLTMFYRIAAISHTDSHFAWIAASVSVNLDFSCFNDSINVLFQCKCCLQSKGLNILMFCFFE